MAMRATRPPLLCVLIFAACAAACARAPGEAAAVLERAPAAAAPDTAGAPPTAAPQSSPYTAEVKALGQVTDRFGFERKYVQVAPGLDDAQLADLARRLHALEPETWFWMLDDGSQAAQMMEALPRTAQGDMTGYPADWVEQHTVAHVVMELVPGSGRRWVLARGSGSDVIAVLEPDA